MLGKIVINVVLHVHCAAISLEGIFEFIYISWIFRCIYDCVYYWPWAALHPTKDFNSSGDLEDQEVRQVEEQGDQEDHHAGL